MRYVAVAVSLLFVAALFSLTVAQEQKAAVKHEYIGAKMCKMCHTKDGIFDSWAASKHATAWDGLSEEQKKNEALKAYYTTGTSAKGELLTGVQCEACHGPGNDYKTKSIMENKEQAIANGMIIPDEKTCKKCHNETAPTDALKASAKAFDFAKMKTTGVHAAAKKAAEPNK